MPIVRYKVFGSASKPTIYYLTGYGSQIKWYAVHIRALVRAGFRVVAFEYDKTILHSGDPATLVDSLDYIVDVINRDKSRRKVAGVYGVSLGSWLGANVLVRCHIRSGMFNTGAASMVRVMWDNPWAHVGKDKFKKNGYTRQSLEKAWGPYEFLADGRRWQGKHVVIMSSAGDKILGIDEVRHNIRSWQKAGDDIEWLVTPHLGHGPAIVRNLFRIPSTIKFFKQA